MQFPLDLHDLIIEYIPYVKHWRWFEESANKEPLGRSVIEIFQKIEKVEEILAQLRNYNEIRSSDIIFLRTHRRYLLPFDQHFELVKSFWTLRKNTLHAHNVLDAILSIFGLRSVEFTQYGKAMAEIMLWQQKLNPKNTTSIQLSNSFTCSGIIPEVNMPYHSLYLTITQDSTVVHE
jgi:hypothetical protein